MRWVTVTSACRMQFRAWPLVLKAKWGSRWGRRWSCRGKTERAPPSLGLAGFLSVCASSYLLVTRGSALTESSWWRETLSIATGPVCPPPSVNLMRAALGERSFEAKKKTKCQTLRVDSARSSENLRTVFSNHRVTESTAAASFAEQQISLTQGVGSATAWANISLHGKRSSPVAPWNSFS